MTVTPRQFVRFLDGRAGKQLVVAFLPGHLGGYINTLQTDVRLKHDYAVKLITKHQINFAGFDEIQNAIDHGYCLRDSPNHLSFLFVKDKFRPEVYFLILKTDATRNELWLVTFHRIKQKQFERRLKGAEILREHAEDEFMG